MCGFQNQLDESRRVILVLRVVCHLREAEEFFKLIERHHRTKATPPINDHGSSHRQRFQSRTTFSKDDVVVAKCFFGFSAQPSHAPTKNVEG